MTNRLHFATTGLVVSDEVGNAIANGIPVVALESTVISHGLPYPENLETARGMMRAVAENGAVPAVMAMFGGVLRAGIAEEELNRLNSTAVRKLSVRDLPVAAAKKLDGATTVATTSMAAHAIGVEVFATGGIGGVHRGFGSDVSADLPVLARTPITVVCSGAKSVLDLPATREWLETNGVTVLGFQCDELPGFYARGTGLSIDERVDSVSEAAEIVLARDRIGLAKAVLLAVPAPGEYALDRTEIEAWIGTAVEEAENEGIDGKAVTPFLLSRISELSEGRSLRTNISLLLNNAAVAARLASALKDQRSR